MTNQFSRKVELSVLTDAKALDLSQFRILFKTYAPDRGVPKYAIIRVYNLAPETVAKIQKEYQTVLLNAGYENENYGLIFQGTIQQVYKGKENTTDSFVEIRAADSDLAHNFAHVSKTLDAGASFVDELRAIQDAMKEHGVQPADNVESVTAGGILPRGAVLWGMAWDHLDSLTRDAGLTWSIHNGQLQFTPVTGYQPGEAVVLNSDTGLIGAPEATLNGINVRSLLNPKYKPGGRIQLAESLINYTTIRNQGFPGYRTKNYTPDITADGYYRILTVEHQGDTRGQPWYSDLVCLSLDSSAPINTSVKAYG